MCSQVEQVAKWINDHEDSAVHHLYFIQQSLSSSYLWRSNRSRQKPYAFCKPFCLLKLKYSSVTCVDKKFILHLVYYWCLVFHVINFYGFHCIWKLFANRIFPDYDILYICIVLVYVLIDVYWSCSAA